MSWELKIYSEDGGTLIKTITDGIDPTSGRVCIRGSPVATVRPPGRGEELEFRARRDLFGAGDRSRIQFLIDSTPVFFGVVIFCPPPSTMGAGNPSEDALERYVVTDLSLIIEQTLAREMFFPDFHPTASLDQDIAQVAKRLVEASNPAGITVPTLTNIGQEIAAFYKPATILSDALDDLASQVENGATWYVDATAQLHFVST